MRLRPIVSERFSILGVVENGTCDADEFLFKGEAAEDRSRSSLRQKLRFIARSGFQNVSTTWSHEVDKPHQIYELIQGQIRLFYFKGVDGHIAVCTGGGRKKGRKADPHMVARAVRLKREYFATIAAGTLRIEEQS